LRRLLFAATLAACMAAWAAPADDLKEAQRLYGQGKVPGAMEKVDAYLKEMPKDPQGRFLKGVLLAEEKKNGEAIEVFTALTQEFPELPEPYNNLAVLYAAQGNLDRARAVLELAIQANPQYAMAQENLGDIYARLAGRAYDRALQLDKDNASARAKSAKVKELTSSQRINP
jgi:tetratricopeptide (TPR) repeat protein